MPRFKVWRVYTNDGHEMGEDFLTLERAREVKDIYAGAFPKLKYYIRAVYL